MCGIAGIIHLDEDASVSRDDLVRMANAIVHRGPDAEGIHQRGPVGFAFRRLAIIDVAGGDQPIYNEDGDVAIVFNGEIYNHADLREQLVAKGHRFRTRSDTETILHGYEEWGPRGICERLRGMFAFAIHDGRARRVVLARDRLGIKPLHVARVGRTIHFASELKSFFALPSFPVRLAASAVLDFATLGYVVAPGCILQDVEKLQPGHVAVIEAGRMEVTRYWQAPFEAREIEFHAAAERIRGLLAEAVRIRLMAEVPLGCFLSGGVDSSAVVAAMVDLVGTSVNAVTVGFADARFDERGVAAEVAAHLGIEPMMEEVRADPAILDGVTTTYDEPHADPSDVPTWLLCQATKRRVTVALSGDGGDELFGGYRRYRFDVLENRVRAFVPSVLRRALLGPLGDAWPKGDRLPRPLRAKTMIQNLAREPIDAYYRSVSRILPEEVERLVDPDLLAAAGSYRPIERFRAIDERRGLKDPLFRIRAIDLETWLSDDILAKVDRASMAHSLEVRVPLLDHHMVEFASTLPSRHLIHGGSGKAVFKAAVERSVPREILDRPKHGFDLPVEAWLRGPLRAELAELTESGSPLAGVFRVDRARELIEEHQSGRRNRATELWTLLVFGRWRRRWWDGR